MKYRELGKTGLKVSEIGFGAWAIGGDLHGNSYGPTDDKISTAALQRAIELGLNFLDTADVYGWGHSEELIGKCLRGKRDRVIIATKVGADFYRGMGFQSFKADYIRYALEKSLTRLQTDYIDLYQLHNPPLRLINSESLYEVMKSLKKEGKVRAWGLSIFDPTEGLVALKVGQPDAIQVAYNLFNARAAEVLFPAAYNAGCAIVVREPLSNGFLTGKRTENSLFEKTDFRYLWRKDFVNAKVSATRKLSFLSRPGVRTQAQCALRFALERPEVSVVITGMKTPEQVEENIAASECMPLTAEELASIADLQENDFDL